MNILVIGGAGYIGGHVVRELLDAGHRVTVFDNLSSGQECNLFPDAAFIRGDILDSAALDAVCGGGQGGAFDAVMHLAAFKAAGESMCAPEKYSLNNINGTINILNAVSRAGIRRFVFSSSAAIFGEPRYLPIDEAHPANPENYYGFTKLEIERILAWYDRLKNIRHASLRYFNAAGYDAAGRIHGLEQNPANLIPIIMETAAGLRPGFAVFGRDYDTPDGTCIRDYIHVSDLASAHLRALEYIHTHDTSLVVNLGSETGSSVQTVLDVARRVTGRPIPATDADRRAGDPAKLYATSALAAKLLGWKASRSSLESIIESTWKMYRSR
ncbi:MAG: UDP-glucose 4-epimerase GalE [Spirochaetaceae bacterium]|nr:UDP-glucose 4-epimerase GalE [Spirochaetaceae bacterium]